MLVYFAAPLFSQAEHHFNECLTEKLESMGYQVFLPQRDGVDREKQPYDKMTKEERRLVMFQVEQLLRALEHYRNFRVLFDFTKEVEQG